MNQQRRKRGRPSNAERTARALAAMAPDPPLREVRLPTKEDFIANPVPGEPSHEEIVEYMAAHPPVPPSWTKGQLLNVRNAGECYVITLLGEEFDPHHPERALKFTNPALCQNFVSSWYAREHFDPRAR